MRLIASTLLVVILCLSPLTISAQRLTINPAGVTMTEGEYRDFTVVLSQEPTDEVTVAIVVRGGAAVSLDRTELTFTPSNWSQSQTVKIRAEQDMDSADDEGALILIASGGGYSGDGITVNPETAVAYSPGETIQLNATLQDQDGGPVTGISLEWSSADPSVAVVDSIGKVTAVSFGTTTITAAFATASGAAVISVTDPSSFSDREILEILFETTGGEGWRHRDGWLTDVPLNQWRGVKTNAEGHVTHLNLIYNNLTGVFPPLLGWLRNLEELVLYGNRIAGEIPPSFGNLTQLKILNLVDNLLIGTIPPELGNMSSLEELVLRWNYLTGSIPPELGNLSQLKFLDIGGSNLLTGEIPPELGNLSQLEELSLIGNPLTGEIPPELGNLSQLKILNLYQNYSLTGPIPPELGNLTQLEELGLSSNSFTGSIPSELGNLTQLSELWLSFNSFTGEIPPELGNLTQLKELALFNNSLTGEIPPELGNLTQLEYLVFAVNALSGPIPSGLGNLTQLEELDLSENELTGEIPPELGNLSQLKFLYLYENFLSGPIPSGLGNLTQLEELDLSDNELTGEIPPELGNLAQLKILYVTATSLSGPIPSELGNLAQLEELWMYDNSLMGPIPAELGNLRHLIDLDLSDNSLSGEIPVELGNLTELHYLKLFSNNLMGPIPSELGKLGNLSILDVEVNNLTGQIPPELGNLTGLSELWLADNNDLEGLLPRSFLRTNPELLYIDDTGICPQQDEVFLEWWNRIPDGKDSDCTPEQVDRLALIELYNKTSGALWTSSGGWGDDVPLESWHGVSVGSGRVTELSLPNNSLRNSIPEEIANFTELTVLNLASNSLTGTLPEEISYMSNLTELHVNGNMGLEGVLGGNLANLTKLEVLRFEGTSLCASPNPMFQTWYTNINDVSGTVCINPAEVYLDIPVAYLVQSVQTPQGSVRLVEGRDALLRVFVTGIPGPAFFQHEVVATVRAGDRTHRIEMTRPGDRLAVAVDESDLNNSFNAMVPGDLITPGATLVIEADPGGVIPRAAGSQDRFPATGEEPLNVISVPDMEVTVVPVLEANQPDRSIFEWTDNIGDDSPEVGLFKYAFPFHEFHARSRHPYFTSLDLTSHDGQWGLVLELEALRLLDKAKGYYYGAAASVNGFVRGIARLGGWTSMGKALDEELAHEVGHNLNLDHAPCGGASYTDPDFPHADGSTGAWGFDFRDNTLILPGYHRDIMSYCYDRGWLSDYHFEKVIDYREDVEEKVGRPIAGIVPESDVLVLWGGVQGGELRMEPPFPATAPAQLPEADGPYQLEGLGQDAVLFSLSFTPGEDKFGNKYFFFAIPTEQEWEESLEQIVLTGPEGSVTIGMNDQRALSILRDAQTGQVRGILRNWDGNLPAALEDAEDLSIEIIQGFMDSVHEQR